MLFGGRAPEPTPESLGELTELVKKKKLDLGLSCDGDADRFGIIDAGGEYIPANEVIALAYDHLVVHRGMQGKAARLAAGAAARGGVCPPHGGIARPD